MRTGLKSVEIECFLTSRCLGDADGVIWGDSLYRLVIVWSVVSRHGITAMFTLTIACHLDHLDIVLVPGHNHNAVSVSSCNYE